MLFAPGDALAQSSCDRPTEWFEGLPICPERAVPATWAWVSQVSGYESEEARLSALLAHPDDPYLMHTPFTCRPYTVAQDGSTAAVVSMLVSPLEAVQSGLQPGELGSYTRDFKNLTLVDPEVAELRGDQDAGTWVPPSSPGWFVRRVVEVKRFWDLSVDPEEARALSVLLAMDSSDQPDCAHQPAPVPFVGTAALGVLAALLVGAGCLPPARRDPRWWPLHSFSGGRRPFSGGRRRG